MADQKKTGFCLHQNPEEIWSSIRKRDTWKNDCLLSKPNYTKVWNYFYMAKFVLPDDFCLLN